MKDDKGEVFALQRDGGSLTFTVRRDSSLKSSSVKVPPAAKRRKALSR